MEVRKERREISGFKVLASRGCGRDEFMHVF